MKAYVLAIAIVSAPLCVGAAATEIGDLAPDFSRTDIQGKPVRLGDQRGKLVLLNFWATWCAPCRKEMPAFSRWQTDLGAKGLQVIGVSLDDDVSEVGRFLAQYPVSYPIVMGDAELAGRFGGVLGLPLSYLIDSQGRVIARYQGEVDLPKLEAKVREVLKKSTVTGGKQPSTRISADRKFKPPVC